MYILKNAFKSITRTKWRNILIGTIILVIAISSCVALSIKNSATKLIESYENSTEVIANISMDRTSMRKKMNEKKEDFTTPQEFMENAGNLSLDTQKEYANSEYVSSYYYTTEVSLNGNENLKKVSMDMEFKGRDDKMPEKFNGNMGADFTVIGYSSLDAMSEFVDGIYTIKEGEMFAIDVENICVISDELAEENEIAVGDTITLVNPDDENKTYSLKVSGIYNDSSENENSLFSNAVNQIITNNVTVEKITSNNELKTNSKVSYILTNKEVVESFEKELKDKGLTDFYVVSTNLDTIAKELEPIQNLSSFATTLLLIVLSVGGTILIVINMINIRERKYEIGVLRSIGMKKHNVLLQFVIELFCVTFVAIIIGTTIGSLLTVPISNKLLESEIETAQNEGVDIAKNFGMQDKGGQMPFGMGRKDDIRQTFATNNYVDKLDAVVDIKTVLELVLIGVILTICSSAISMIFISRYSPLKILSSRS